MKSCNKFVFLLIGLFFLACSQSVENIPIEQEKKESDWEKHSLKGDVKKIHTTIYWFRIDAHGNRLGNIIGTKELDFDDRGNLIKRVGCAYPYSADSCTTEIYRYDEKNNLLEYTQTFASNIKEYIKHIYDLEGREIEYCEYSEGKFKKRTKWLLNKSGSLDEEIFYNENNVVIEKIKCSYNRKGYRTKEETYDMSDKLTSKLVFKYNKTGERVLTKIYDKSGNVIEKQISKFDKKGNQIEEIIYHKNDYVNRHDKYIYGGQNGDKLVEITSTYEGNKNRDIEYSYNNNGELIESRRTLYDNKGKISDYEGAKFNDEGQLIEKIKTDRHNRERRSIYVYDKKGSVVEEITYEQGIIVSKTKKVYDIAGNEIESYEWAENERLRSIKKQTFDQIGNIMESVLYCYVLSNNIMDYITINKIEYY